MGLCFGRVVRDLSCVVVALEFLVRDLLAVKFREITGMDPEEFDAFDYHRSRYHHYLNRSRDITALLIERERERKAGFYGTNRNTPE